jgi:hypothetical protein
VPINANEEKQSVDDPVTTNTASADEITRTHARVLCAEGLLEQFAIADPVSPAGWTVGISLGAALPQGVYFIDTGTCFERSASAPGAPKIDAGVNLPLIAWSTPYTILGGRVQVLATVPELAIGINPGAPVGSSWHRDVYNPAGLVGGA